MIDSTAVQEKRETRDETSASSEDEGRIAARELAETMQEKKDAEQVLEILRKKGEPKEEIVELGHSKRELMLEQMEPVLKLVNKATGIRLSPREHYEVRQLDDDGHSSREGIKWVLSWEKSTQVIPLSPVTGLSYDRAKAWSIGLFNDKEGSKIVLQGRKSREFDYNQALRKPKALEKAVKSSLAHARTIPGSREVGAGLTF